MYREHIRRKNEALETAVVLKKAASPTNLIKNEGTNVVYEHDQQLSALNMLTPADSTEPMTFFNNRALGGVVLNMGLRITLKNYKKSSQ
ncbi:hypothetical protein Vi05172_g6583 [Venturia inaequalis]|nr:hypothetical protein Vi05172_g6583 [Venturia inaequalis]